MLNSRMRTTLRVSFIVILLIASVVSAQEIRRFLPNARLDESSLQDITFSSGQSAGLRPGSEYVVNLIRWNCCWYQLPASVVSVTYALDPPDQGVSVDRSTGVVTVSPDARPGTKVRLYASLNFGRRFMSQDIYVFAAQTH